MKKELLVSLGLLIASGTAFCSASVEPNQKNLSVALTRYLQQHGDFCLGKYDWPIDVSDSDVDMRTRDALQMPVLEKLGLVASSDETVMRKTSEDVEESVAVRRYSLTESGRKFYQARTMSTAAPDGKEIIHHGDFCAGKLSLDKIIKWDKPVATGNRRETTVSYTYKFAAAEWTHDQALRNVFPMIARLIDGEGTMQLQQRFRLSGKSWIAINPRE